MLKKIFILAMGVGFVSQSAFAIFEAHGLVGKRWYKHDEGGTQATILNLDAYLTLPLPILMLGFGPGLEYNQVREGDTGFDSTDTATITKLSAKALVGVSLPLTGLQVYGKLGFNLWSAGEFKGKNAGVDMTTKFTTPGTNISLGLRYSFIPLVGILAEANFGQEKFDEFEENGVKQSKDLDANSSAFLIGVNVGI